MKCGPGWFNGGDQVGCFHFGTEGMHWNIAFEYCRSLNSQLAEVHNETTQAFLRNTAKSIGNHTYWLGATAASGHVSVYNEFQQKAVLRE